MSWAEVQLSLQLMAEERYGAPQRGRIFALKAREDAAAGAAAAAVSRL